ncbi:hypothetical protein [Actinoplanes sp. M2I2]|uniref:hypothetical protein n=1 Tax=Actinoplanes sp. M2I2 TaxID=1734444 RepID=UPI002021E102|nr:hypothetical protein [Actinoplanes sp. M2I2]
MVALVGNDHVWVAARQQSRCAQQTAAPVAPERDTATLIAQLKELGHLRDVGVLSAAEFDVQKAHVLHR